MATERVISNISNYLRERDNVLLAIIFGSFLEQRITEESDLDIAILFRGRPSFSVLSDIMDVISELSGLKTDIVVLNTASPIIKMQVLKKGKVLKDADEKMYNDFFLRTVKEYNDLKRVRKEQEQNILQGRLYAGP